MLAAIIGVLTQPLSVVTSTVTRRASSSLLLAAAALTGLSLLLPQPVAVRWPLVLTALAAALVTVLVTFVERAQPVAPVIPVLVAGEIFTLVLGTGGTTSAYLPYYPVLLVLVAIFGTTWQPLVTGLVVSVLALGPLLVPSAEPEPGELTHMLVRLAVWLVSAAFVRHLVRELRDRNQRVREQEQWYRSLFDHNPDAVFSIDPHGRFTSVNPEACRLLGVPADQVVGAPFERFLVPEESGPTRSRFLAGLEGMPQRYDTQIVDSHGRRVDVAIVNVPIVVGQRVTGIYGVAKDVSTVKAMQAALAEQALHDQLTGLANRRLLIRRIEDALADASRAGSPVAVLMLDLDGFKHVNDTFGHGAGDALLVEATARLRRCTRAVDTLARIGGDEFVLLLPGTTADEAVLVAERIHTQLQPPIVVMGHPVALGASVGIAVTEDGAPSVDQLLRHADDAMYAAKRAGRGRYRLFHPDLLVPELLEAVPVADARAWHTYVSTLRRDIAERQRVGALPPGLRAPRAVHRTLEQLLAAIDDLPARQLAADLTLPDRVALEEFVYHQTAVQHWVDALTRQGVLTNRRPPAADRFWARMTSAVEDVRPGAACSQVA